MDDVTLVVLVLWLKQKDDWLVVSWDIPSPHFLAKSPLIQEDSGTPYLKLEVDFALVVGLKFFFELLVVDLCKHGTEV